MGKRSQTDRYERILGGLIRLAKDIADLGVRRKVMRGETVWAFALLARIRCGAVSITLLTRSGHLWDAKLLVRSVYESLIDLLYLLHDPRKRD
jgi:hypothetical protein